MTHIIKSALVQYSNQEMFDLVHDINAYPEFLPWCGSAKILSQTEAEVVAEIEIAHKGIHKSFTTVNQYVSGSRIEIQLVKGPFKTLQGHWSFESLRADACKIGFDMEYEFSNALLRVVVGPVFNQIANTLMDAFCLRAAVKYGKR